MNRLKTFYALLRFYSAVNQASKAHKTTGERYYVMPVGKKGRLIIMDRDNFRKLKRKHYVTNSATVSDLEKECFFCTPYRNGDGRLPLHIANMKRKEYLNYFAKTTNRRNRK